MEFEIDRTASPAAVATFLRRLADELTTGGPVAFEDGGRTAAVEAPTEVELEVELERDGDEIETEVELEWTSPEAGGDGEAAPGRDDAGDHPTGSDDTGDDSGPADARPTGEGADSPAEERDSGGIGEGAKGEDGTPDQPLAGESLSATADPPASLARFQVYRDRGDQWRWRLRHRNGNIIATGGQGYTRKHNAEKGLRSVVANVPGAEVDRD